MHCYIVSIKINFACNSSKLLEIMSYYPKQFKTCIWIVNFIRISRYFGYRIAQNVGGGKHWRIWRLSIDSPKFSHPNIINTLKCNGKPTQFAKVLPSNHTSRVISPKFHPTNILRYTVSVSALD